MDRTLRMRRLEGRMCVCVCVCVTESRASIRGSRYRKELDVAPKPGDQAVEKRNEKKDKYGMVEQ